MNWTHLLLRFVNTHEDWMLIAVSAVTVFLLFLNICLLWKLGRLSRNTKSALTMLSDSPVGESIELMRRMGKSEEDVALLNEHQNVLQEHLTRSVQKVGLVRFDAFPDIGGEQSFALALLDGNMNGVVLSNLYGRTDSRVYAKEIVNGSSAHTLSNEEKEAIRRAGNPSC
ncbi:MAG TPA: DUF4446 family protein [Armatimonadota bacterium]|nr:DUF4446 family protein [Armatimonadota bacterium]